MKLKSNVQWKDSRGVVMRLTTFYEPVIEQYPVIASEYLNILRINGLTPMDFKSIADKCGNTMYASTEEFLEDAQLVVKCCNAYNKQTLPEYVRFAEYVFEEANKLIKKEFP